MTEQEVWLNAWYAAIACDNCGSKTATEIADRCLEACKERFPEPELPKVEYPKEIYGGGMIIRPLVEHRPLSSE